MKLQTVDEKKGVRTVRLRRPIYGLKQSGHNWNDALDSFLVKIGHTRLSSSNCVYRLSNHTFVVVYVDDILIFSGDEKTLSWVTERIGSQYEIRDLGEISYFLGVGVRQSNGEVVLSQQAYIRSLLRTFGMTECRPSCTPLQPGTKLSKDDGPSTHEEKGEMKNVPYRELVGLLMYVAQCTRPDIAYAVAKLSQFSFNPGRTHWVEAKRVLRYLSGTLQHGLKYRRTTPSMELWTDADWAGDLDDSHSFSGMAVSFGGNVVDWRASKQKCITLSTMEAEYVAMSAAAREATWAIDFIEDLGLSKSMWCDNRSAIDFAKNRIERSNTKHIRRAHHYVREMIDRGEVTPKYVPTTENLVDIFTKSLDKNLHREAVTRLGLMPASE